METIIYFVRHSTKFHPDLIESYRTKDDKQTKTEKKMLSVEGEKRALLLSQQEEFQKIDAVYCSNYVRAMQTAKYFIDGKNLKLNIDERFNERKIGEYQTEKYPNFFCDQYWNPELKGTGGECQVEVNQRMTEAFWEVVKKHPGEKVVIVSHGTAISFLLMNWCKLLDVQANYLRNLQFQDRIIINRPYRAPEVFKVTVNENQQVVNIENIEFEGID